MPALVLPTIEQRVASVCARPPFSFIQAVDPFSFTQQPTGAIDAAFRIEAVDLSVVSGTNYSETRIGQLRIFIARKQGPDPNDTKRRLLTEAQSLTAAIVHDGITGGGDYDVADSGRGSQVQHTAGQEYAVLRLTLPVNYEAQL